jgi:hypothetical protein
MREPEEKILKAFDTAFAESKVRESNLDIKSMDIVDSCFRERPLFHTYNHPVNWLLNRIVERISEKLTGQFKNYNDNVKNEYLGEIIQAIPSYLADHLGLKYRQDDYVVAGKVMMANELISASYQAYASIANFYDICCMNKERLSILVI